jgi:hypothetical protein
MITVEWANGEQNILRWQFIQPWTWEEFYNAQMQMNAMIDSVTGNVDCIFLTSKTQLLPSHATIHLRKIIAQQHERLNLIVIVGANRFVSTLMQVMTHWVPDFANQLRFTPSEQDAFPLIEQAWQKTA